MRRVEAEVGNRTCGGDARERPADGSAGEGRTFIDVGGLWSGFRLEDEPIDINVEAVLSALDGRACGASAAGGGRLDQYRRRYQPRLLDARWQTEFASGLFVGLGLGAAVHDGKLDRPSPIARRSARASSSTSRPRSACASTRTTACRSTSSTPRTPTLPSSTRAWTAWSEVRAQVLTTPPPPFFPPAPPPHISAQAPSSAREEENNKHDGPTARETRRPELPPGPPPPPPTPPPARRVVSPRPRQAPSPWPPPPRPPRPLGPGRLAGRRPPPGGWGGRRRRAPCPRSPGCPGGGAAPGAPACPNSLRRVGGAQS